MGEIVEETGTGSKTHIVWGRGGVVRNWNRIHESANRQPLKRMGWNGVCE